MKNSSPEIRLPRHISKLCLSLLLLFPLAAFAQIEMPDTIANGLPHPALRFETNELPDSLSPENGHASYLWDYYTSIDPLFAYIPPQVIDLHIPDLYSTPGQAVPFCWGSGAVVASGGVQTFPGLMQIDNGAIGIHQQIGNLSLYAGAIAHKYGYFRGLHTQYGIDGSISYQIAPRLSVTAFGEYYFGRPPLMANGMPMPPSMVGYYGRSKFGGYVDYQIDERWGVQTGVQTVNQFGANRYEAEPIVTPYYKISKKVAIGLPVGQILYHILKK